jgi:hypothetical protein
VSRLKINAPFDNLTVNRSIIIFCSYAIVLSAAMYPCDVVGAVVRDDVNK